MSHNKKNEELCEVLILFICLSELIDLMMLPKQFLKPEDELFFEVIP